jgi:hypothetical protein
MKTMGTVAVLGMVVMFLGCRTTDGASHAASTGAMQTPAAAAQFKYVCAMPVPNGEDPAPRVDRLEFQAPVAAGSAVVWTPFGQSGQANFPETLTVENTAALGCKDCAEITANGPGTTFRFTIKRAAPTAAAKITAQYKQPVGGPPNFVPFGYEGACQVNDQDVNQVGANCADLTIINCPYGYVGKATADCPPNFGRCVPVGGASSP